MTLQRLGPYRLLSELGAGGMGVVYLAEAEAALGDLPAGTHVALKVIHAHLVGRPGFRQRFHREARVGRRVRHENVVSTYEIDSVEVDGSETLYLVMEYVVGRTLRALLEDLERVPEALLREIGRQVAAGLAAIHEAGVVHRDLKPENVLITEDDQVRIMDLGVARVVDDTFALSEAGHFAGSLLYAAPEQFQAGETGTAADLYSFGATLYELATGQNPFRGPDASSIIRAQLELIPPLLTQGAPEASPFLAEVVATLLAKEPTERYPSAAYVCDLLAAGETSSWWAGRAKDLRKATLTRPRVPVPHETALYGREQELEALRVAWRQACTGSGRTILLEGEAGIGKSRLADAFVQEVATGDVHVLYGSYPPSGGIGGLSSSIVTHLGRANLAASLEPYLRPSPALAPAFAAILKRDSLPLGAEPVTGDAIHALTVYLMRGLAAEKPVLWVVDDLHFAGPDSRKVALSMARAVEGHPVLLLLTTRPGMPEEELAHFTRLESLERLSVGRLSPRQVMELLRDAFGSVAVASRLGGDVAWKSDGVPFFVFEMIHGLKDGNFLERGKDGTYTPTRDLEDMEVPSVVRDLIQARLSRLTPQERAILDVGAVQGFEFDAGLVARVLERKPIPVLQSLAEIERHSGIVRATGRLSRFDHHQIQEVVYQALPEALRVEYHAALADARAAAEGVVDREPAEIPGELAAFLASHHLRGSRPKQALPFLEGALDHLESSYRNEALVDLTRRAVEHPGLLEPDVCIRFLLRRAQRLGYLGMADVEGAALQDALALATSYGKATLLADVKTRIGWSHLRSARYEQAETILGEARVLAEGAGDERREAAATEHIGIICYLRARYDEARTHLERARLLAHRAGDAQAEAQAAGGLGLVMRAQGHYEEARAFQERHLAMARETGDRRGEMNALGNIANLHNYRHRYEEAAQTYELALEVARRIGHRYGEAALNGSLGGVLWVWGRLEEAQGNFEGSLLLDREIGNREGEARMLLNLAGMWRRLGEWERAETLLQDALHICRDIGARLVEGHALLGLGGVQEEEGRSREARRRYETAVALFREIGQAEGLATALEIQGTFFHGAGELEAGRDALEEALALRESLSDAFGEAACLCELALLPGGDVARASAAFDKISEEAGVFQRLSMLRSLWRASEDEVYRREAVDLLADLQAHAPEPYRASMLERVPLYRELRQA